MNWTSIYYQKKCLGNFVTIIYEEALVNLKLGVCSRSLLQLHEEVVISRKPCFNLCLGRWLNPTLGTVREVIPLEFLC